jgi:glycerol-3-phosphate dehydrogenase (NAD(P)+)
MVAVVGGGAWGTALATAVTRAGADARLWVRESEVADDINQYQENRAFLPGVALPAALRATTDLEQATRGVVALILAVPAQHLRQMAKRLAGLVAVEPAIVIAAKGIELGTGKTMREVLADELPRNPCAVLSGPTFAAEVARGLPTAVTLAVGEPRTGSLLLPCLGSAGFRVYLSDDPIGCEIGGAVKNVLAIACGIVSGRKLGDNARAALITRGLAEMGRLARAKGGNPATLMGLSGLGDLTLTCTSSQSRNYSLGEALGRGETLDAINAGRRSVAEGVDSAASIHQLAQSMRIEMPIVAGVNAILHHHASIDDEIRRLLTRPLTVEAAVEQQIKS